MRRLWVPMLALILLLPVSAAAQTGEVKFRVRVLLATKEGNRVDPQIGANVQRYLKKSFGARYSSFRQLDSRVMRVALDETSSMSLPDQSELKLRYRDMRGEFIRLTMEIKDLRTTIRIRNGGLFFQAGHRYQNGMLILAISAVKLEKGKDKKVKERLTRPRPEPRPGPQPTTPRRNRPIDRKAH